MNRRNVLALLVSATCAAAVGATFAISFASDAGRSADATVFRHAETEDPLGLRHLGRSIGVHPLNVLAAASVLVIGSALVLMSALGKTRFRWWFIPLLVGGAFVTTEVLKSALGTWERELAPFRAAQGAFPSGHATLAMATVLAAVIAVPRSIGALTAIGGGLVAAGSGLLIVVGGLHPSSDVVAGYLVAATWGSLLTPFLRTERAPASVAGLDRRTRFAFALTVVLCVVAAGVVVVTLRSHVFVALVASFVFLSTVLVVAVRALGDVDVPHTAEA